MITSLVQFEQPLSGPGNGADNNSSATPASFVFSSLLQAVRTAAGGAPHASQGADALLDNAASAVTETPFQDSSGNLRGTNRVVQTEVSPKEKSQATLNVFSAMISVPLPPPPVNALIAQNLSCGETEAKAMQPVAQPPVDTGQAGIPGLRLQAGQAVASVSGVESVSTTAPSNNPAQPVRREENFAAVFKELGGIAKNDLLLNIPSESPMRSDANQEVQKLDSTPINESAPSPTFPIGPNSDAISSVAAAIPTSDAAPANPQNSSPALTASALPPAANAPPTLVKPTSENQAVVRDARTKVGDGSLKFEARIPRPIAPQSTSNDGFSVAQSHQGTSARDDNPTESKDRTPHSGSGSASPGNDPTGAAVPPHSAQQGATTTTFGNGSASPSSPGAIGQVEGPASPYVFKQAENLSSNSGPALPPQSTPSEISGQVNIARIVTGLSQSEMHIGLHTQAFGSVEVHTTVRDSQIGLTLGSEKGDLRNVLAPEIGSIQSSFKQQDLHLESVRFLESSTGAAFGSSDQHHGEARQFASQHGGTAHDFAGSDGQEGQSGEVLAGENISLSVLA